MWCRIGYHAAIPILKVFRGTTTRGHKRSDKFLNGGLPRDQAKMPLQQKICFNPGQFCQRALVLAMAGEQGGMKSDREHPVQTDGLSGIRDAFPDIGKLMDPLQECVHDIGIKLATFAFNDQRLGLLYGK